MEFADLEVTLQFTLKLRAVAKVHHKRWSDAAFCYLSRGNKLCENVQGLRHGKNIVSLICQPVLHHTIDCTNDDNQKSFLPTRSSMVTLDSVAVEIARPQLEDGEMKITIQHRASIFQPIDKGECDYFWAVQQHVARIISSRKQFIQSENLLLSQCRWRNSDRFFDACSHHRSSMQTICVRDGQTYISVEDIGQDAYSIRLCSIIYNSKPMCRSAQWMLG
ncbi:hypothetical protein T05_14120, partial [Trichinella murrelli]